MLGIAKHKFTDFEHHAQLLRRREWYMGSDEGVRKVAVRQVQA